MSRKAYMKNYSKLLAFLLLSIITQSCATLHCERLAGKEKQACISSAHNAGALNSMWAGQGAIDAGNAATEAANAAAQGAMMPPPMMH